MDDTTKIIIASHSEREAITACLIKHRPSVELVLLSDLLNHFEIFDCMSDKGTRISWSKSNGQVITNDNCILINRIMQVSSELFLSFVEHDRFYAQREFEAYLGFSLNAFVGFSNTSPNGLCGQFLSLPQQWEAVRGVEGLFVPDYYWGLALFNRLYGQERLIYSSIYSLFNWTICGEKSGISSCKDEILPVVPAKAGIYTQSSTEVNRWIDHRLRGDDRSKVCEITESEPVFCFLKPYGLPVFVCCIAGHTLITGHSNLTVNSLQRIEHLVTGIKQRFDYFAYEILLFIQDDLVTFGCINHEIVKSIENPLFESFVLSSVDSVVSEKNRKE